MQMILSRASKTLRLRTAIAVVALYAFSVLAPSVALAAAPETPHCLMEAGAEAHVHKHDGAVEAKRHTGQ
jgi:hypothetical protein